MKSFALKSRTSAALCARRPAVSKRSISLTAELPEASSARKASIPMAPGAITPMPVTGIRRPRAGALVGQASAIGGVVFICRRIPEAASGAPEQQRDVAAAEAERVGEDVRHGQRPRRVRNVVQRAVFRVLLETQSGRRELFLQGEDADHRLHGARGAEGVAEIRLRR